nr:uncharacterized protein LOC128681809 isoform X2 [Plodia interpunctella]
MYRIFNKLPEAKCCFWLPLRIACGIIAVFYILTGTGTIIGEDIGSKYVTISGDYNKNISGHFYRYTCFEGTHSERCTQKGFQTTLNILFLIFLDFTLRCASVALLVGVFIKHVLAITAFLYVYAIVIIINILALMILICIGFFGSCPTAVPSKYACMVTILIAVVVISRLLVLIEL